MTTGRNASVSRREVLAGAIAMVGGASLLAGCSDKEIGQLDLHAGERRFFDPDQSALLTRVADVVMPATDTPGAIGAGVDRFIDGLMADWASASTSARVVATLGAIDETARQDLGRAFVECGEGDQAALLGRLAGSASGDDAQVPGFGELRNLILAGYYTSEVGASVELQFELVPGRYLECVPVEEIGRAWAYR